MRVRVIYVLSLCAFSGICAAQSLHDYLVTQKWNPAKSGLLIAVAADSFGPHTSGDNDQTPPDISSYSRQYVRLGQVTAVAPVQRIDFPDEGLANPYDALTDSDKLAAFLGSLNTSQWRELSSRGLAPSNVTGTQRQLLLSIIPHPLNAQQVVYGKEGYGTEGDQIPVKPEVAQEVRLQVFKALDVGFAPLIDPKTKISMLSGVSSMTYRPEGTHLYRAVTTDRKPGSGGYYGQIVENDEKRSELVFKNPALSVPIELKDGETVSDLFESIRNATHMEIYADARLGKHKLAVIGDHAMVSDVLRAVALCVSGTYRRVGPAYVLTIDIEGQATRGLRALANSSLAQIAIQSKVIAARAEIKSGRLLDQLDFLPDDIFHAKSFLNTINVAPSASIDPGWFPASVMNSTIKAAVPFVNASGPVTSGNNGEQTLIPDPNLQDKIHLQVTVGFRYIMPNGIALESQPLNLDSGSVQYGSSNQPPAILPMDASKLPTGCSVGYRTDDVAAVKQFCDEAKQHGIKAVRIETKKPQVIEAAVASGLTVDLVVRPWEMLSGDVGEFDRNAIGQSGSELNQIPAARIDYSHNETSWFTTSFAPASTGLDSHWSRLATLAGNKQIRRVILMDPIPIGYDHDYQTDYDRIQSGGIYINGVLIPKSLHDLVPDVFQFGYTVALRLECLRKFGMDPIDLEHPFRRAPFARIPFFEVGDFWDSTFPNGRNMESDLLGIYSKFQKLRNDAAMSGVHQAIDRLSVAGHPIWLFYAGRREDRYRSPLRLGPASALGERFSQDRDAEEIITVNPLTAEEANGTLNYILSIQLDKPTCFDFSDVPLSRLSGYFEWMFKSAK